MLLLSRLALALLSVLTLATILPAYVGQIFPQDYENVLISWSADQERLIFRKYRGGKWSYSDAQGHALSESEMRSALPFAHTRELDRLGQLPEAGAGWPFDIREVSKYSARLRLTPRQLDKPAFSLYTLLESEPGASGLETPADMFRMTQRLEFIDTASNRIDEDKSQRFDQALTSAGFVHPARLVGDDANTRKDYDNGALLVDAQGRVFHLWQVGGKPQVTRTDTTLPPSALAIRVLQLASREYHGIVVLTDGLLFLDWENHAPRPIPLDGYRPARDFFSAEENPLHWEFSHAQDGTGSRKFVLTDRELNPLLRHVWHEDAADAEKRAFRANVMGFLFPFKLDFHLRDSSQRSLYFTTFSADWRVKLAGIASALCAYGLWSWWSLRGRYRHTPRPHALDWLLILFTSWFGVITLALLGSLAHQRAKSQAGQNLEASMP